MISAEHPTARWFETRGAAALLTMRVSDIRSISDLILRSPPQVGVSKDEATAPEDAPATAGAYFEVVAWQR
jgi:hypothetical protein